MLTNLNRSVNSLLADRRTINTDDLWYGIYLYEDTHFYHLYLLNMGLSFFSYFSLSWLVNSYK